MYILSKEKIYVLSNSIVCSILLKIRIFSLKIFQNKVI